MSTIYELLEFGHFGQALELLHEYEWKDFKPFVKLAGEGMIYSTSEAERKNAAKFIFAMVDILNENFGEAFLWAVDNDHEWARWLLSEADDKLEVLEEITSVSNDYSDAVSFFMSRTEHSTHLELKSRVINEGRRYLERVLNEYDLCE